MRRETLNASHAHGVWRPVQHDPAAVLGAETTRPSSNAQKEIFSASMTDVDASRAYNHSITVFFEGALDIDALYSALLNLLQRHEALRGVFSSDGETFRVREACVFSLPLIDFCGKLPEEQKADYERWVRAELDHVFDPVHGPLFRASLLKFGADSWALVFSCHHIIVDGWSLKIILDDLPKLYNHLVDDRELADSYPLRASSSFVDYLGEAVERENTLGSEASAFWKRCFADGVPALDLPLDRMRPPLRTYESSREDFRIRREVYERLKETGARSGNSQFVTLLSAFSLFLYRISGQRDHVIGVPAAGQIRSGLAGLLGHDARVLPVRCQVSDDDSFDSFSRKVGERFFEAYENQWIGIPRLLQDLKVGIDPARVPLMSVMFNFDPGMKQEEFAFSGLKARHFFNHRNFETFEISINAVVEEQDLVLECAYNKALFDSKRMHERLEQLETLMESISRDPAANVLDLALLPPAHEMRSDEQLNRTAREYPRALCVDEWVQATVERNPRRVAVESGSRSLTYQETWDLSGRVAGAIRARGLGDRKPLIGVMLERDERVVPALLAVWRVGGAFVPLDPSYPPERIQYMVEQSGIQLILSRQATDALHLNVDEALAFDGCSDEQGTPQGTPFRRDPEDLAYVIFTSGSTGKPKGVQVPHRALCNFLASMRDEQPRISVDDRLLSVTTLSFDIAELELWLPLVSGARVVIADRATTLDGQALISTIRSRGITIMQATPATWRLLLISGWDGDLRLTALCGGEAMTRDLADALARRVKTLWNMYGPTETTVWSTMDRVRPHRPISIGKPIGNTQVYVVDPRGNRVPDGVIGELCIGGDGVTHGYLGRPDLTDERFIPNRFTGRGLVYRTGDLARIALDGRIEYIGRNDFQVKIRGFRIELGEIQTVLARHESLEQVVVAVKERVPGDPHLVAYYRFKPLASARTEELKGHLRGQVPEYMIPTRFIEMKEFPLTFNGKVDVKALPFDTDVGTSDAAADPEFQAPRSPTEVYLARLWAEILGANRVGRKDRFLELGGHSLLAVQTLQRIKREKGLKISPKSIILKSLEQLASEMDGVDSSPEPGSTVAGKTRELAMYFGSEARRKFGYYHPPAQTAAGGACVVISPPLGQEYMRTHWMIRKMAASFHQKGLGVFRFDYFGQGDSSGSPEEIRLSWLVESLLEAANEARRRSGARELKLVAFRGSALVASQMPIGTFDDVILVDPPRSGADYVANLRSAHKARWAASPFRKGWIQSRDLEEILGATYNREFVAELEQLACSDTLASRMVALKTEPDAGWNDFTRIEQVWLSPELVAQATRLLVAGKGDSQK